jgi:hypothetical protein
MMDAQASVQTLGVGGRRIAEHASREAREWGSLPALVGGALFVLWAALMAVRPPGGPWGYRPVDDLAPLLLLGILLIGAGWVARFARDGGRSGIAARVGFGIGMAASALLVVSAVLMTVAPDTSLMPLVVIPGILLLIVGSVVFALASARAGTMWPLPAVSLIGASVLLLAANTEDWRAWLFAPYGLAWVLVGAVLLASRLAGRR